MKNNLENHHLDLPLRGLKCGGCVKKLTDALKQALPPEADISVTRERAKVVGHVSRAEVEKIITDLGYHIAVPKPISLHLAGLSCGKCVNKIVAALNAREDIFSPEVSKTELKAMTTAPAAEIISLIQSLGYEASLTPFEDNPAPLASKTAPAENLSQMPFHQYVLTGMTCASCVQSVEKAIAAVAGVEDVRVSLAERTASVSGAAAPAAVIDAVTRAGYQAVLQDDEQERRAQLEKTQRNQYEIFKRHAFIALTVGAPVMLWGMFGGTMSVNTPASRFGWGVIALITLALLATVGRHYFVSALRAARYRRANMDTLVALGTSAAWLYSAAVVIAPDAFPASARHVYFEATAMILGLVTLGHAIETRARARTGSALSRLLDLRPQTATVVVDDQGNHQEKIIALAQVQTGMTLRLKAGEKVPVDGVITAGESYIDESMLTGEPLAVHKSVNDPVFAGTINQNGALLFTATKIGQNTLLAQIIALVRQAQTSKPALAHLADRIAAIFVPVVMGIALLTALIWFFFAPPPTISFMLITSVTVLIIACPCALGLATPLSVTCAVGKAAELGILVRDASALQLGAAVDTVVFDKTGTLTAGKPQLTTVHAFCGSDQALLRVAVALETLSSHPLARAILAETEKPSFQVEHIEKFQEIRGKGVCGLLSGVPVALGNAAMMAQMGIATDKAAEMMQTLGKNGETPVFVAENGQLLGLLGVSDPLREDSAAAINTFKRLGLQVVMLTGDTRATATAIGQKLGISEIIAEVLPDQKAAVIAERQKRGQKVAMVGDGINDAPALAQADVGIAMGGGSDIAIESAAFTLMRHSIASAADALALSRATLRNMKGNLLGAFVYNTIGIPVAAGILYPFTGILLSPVIASAAMALSSITVVMNANRLRFFRSPTRD